jgi:hypothetical protein
VPPLDAPEERYGFPEPGVVGVVPLGVEAHGRAIAAPRARGRVERPAAMPREADEQRGERAVVLRASREGGGEVCVSLCECV